MSKLENDHSSLKDDLFRTASAYDNGRVTERGEEADISKLNDLNYGIYEEFSTYNTLPESLDGSRSLYFRTKIFTIESKNRSCFRIGGDEFVVILSGDNIDRSYEQGIAGFQAEIKQHNDIPDKEFALSLAHGFAMYDKNSGEESLMDVYQQADMKMYENKKEIKANSKQKSESAAI